MSDDEAVETSVTRRVREAAQLATQAAQFYRQQIARLQEWVRRDALNSQRRAEAQARYHAAWEQARKELEVVHEAEWWQEATPKQIGEVYKTATIWRDYEDAARDTHDVIHTQLQDRYGIDLTSLSREDVIALVAARTEHTLDTDAEFPHDLPPDQDPPDPTIDGAHDVPTRPELSEEHQEIQDRVALMQPPGDPHNPADASQSHQNATRMQTRTRFRQSKQTVEV